MATQQKNRVIVTVGFPPDIARRIDDYAKYNHLNRSQAITNMVRSFLDAEDAKPSVMQMMEGMGSFMGSLLSMSKSQIIANAEQLEQQLEKLPESVKNQIPDPDGHKIEE